ncbi:hypothetical protein BGZ93_005606 [Podila epicladia]|nr:hypothetical protein BGZ92_001102 [Podila epicladia]KAG0099847.1 hypothetical protein BGZ93_005606 [Podila epicladia]
MATAEYEQFWTTEDTLLRGTSTFHFDPELTQEKLEDESRGLSAEPGPTLATGQAYPILSVEDENAGSLDEYDEQDDHYDPSVETTHALRLELSQDTDEFSPRIFTLKKFDSVLLGRASSKTEADATDVLGWGAQPCMFSNKVISKAHASICHQDGALFIEDENSTHGTFVNGQRIKTKAPLNHGDTLVLGRHVVRKEESFKPLKLNVRIQEIIDIDHVDEDEQVRRLQGLDIHDPFFSEEDEQEVEEVEEVEARETIEAVEDNLHIPDDSDTDEDIVPASDPLAAQDTSADRDTDDIIVATPAEVEQPIINLSNDAPQGTKISNFLGKRKRSDEPSASSDSKPEAHKRRASLVVVGLAGVVVGSVGTVLALANI